MSFRVTSITNDAGVHETHHYSPDTGHLLSVTHNPAPEPGTRDVSHFVSINPYTSTKHSPTLWYPSEMHGTEKSYLGNGQYGSPPSAELQSLIAHHHLDHAWMPLLDKLAEEYPEHFEDAVRNHTVARASS